MIVLTTIFVRALTILCKVPMMYPNTVWHQFIDTCIAVGIMKSDISLLLTDEDLEMIRIWSRKARRIAI